MTPHKHSPLPWAVRSQEFDDWGIIRDADLERAARAEWSRDDDLDSHRVAGTDPAQPNADFIVLACNSYYANQATIAAQAARIAWLERPMTGDEFDAAVMAFWRVYSTEGKKPRKERLTNEACADEAMRQSIAAALAIRTKPENGE